MWEILLKELHLPLSDTGLFFPLFISVILGPDRVNSAKQGKFIKSNLALSLRYIQRWDHCFVIMTVFVFFVHLKVSKILVWHMGKAERR